MPMLRIHKGRKHLFDFSLLPETKIGRSEASDISLNGEAISRTHVVVRQHGNSYVAEDVSQNGMFVNGETVSRHLLRPQDKIEIAQYVLTYYQGEPKIVHQTKIKRSRRQINIAPVPQKEEATAFVQAVDLKKLRDGVAARRRAHLAFLADGTRNEFMLGDEHLIGWDEDCDIRLPGKKWFASCVAYVWKTEEGTYQIEQETFWRKLKVNGSKAKIAILQDNDEVEVSGIKIRFHSDLEG